MKIMRHLDGKVYQVHNTRPVDIMGVRVGAVDVLITHPQDGGQMWIDGYEVDFVPDDTPVDVK